MPFPALVPIVFQQDFHGIEPTRAQSCEEGGNEGRMGPRRVEAFLFGQHDVDQLSTHDDDLGYRLSSDRFTYFGRREGGLFQFRI